MEYKQALKNQIRILSKRTSHKKTLKSLARHLKIQYTYLSKVINSPKIQMNEDQLCDAVDYLEFSPHEAKRVQLMRIIEGSTSYLRRSRATQKLAGLATREFDAIQINQKSSNSNNDWQYMLDPIATIVLVALSIKPYRNDPLRLIGKMGIDENAIRKAITALSKAGILAIGKHDLDIVKIEKPRIHFSQEHPLMRLHQQQFRVLALTHLLSLPEAKKRSFSATFTADEYTFEQIKAEIKLCLGKIENLAKNSPGKKTYQLILDAFEWF